MIEISHCAFRNSVNIFLHFVVCLLPPTPPPSPPPHLSQCCEGCAVSLWRCGPGGGRLVCGGTISLHYWYGSSACILSLILSSPCPSVPPSPSPCTSCPHSFPSPTPSHPTFHPLPSLLPSILRSQLRVSLSPLLSLPSSHRDQYVDSSEHQWPSPKGSEHVWCLV